MLRTLVCIDCCITHNFRQNKAAFRSNSLLSACHLVPLPRERQAESIRQVGHFCLPVTHRVASIASITGTSEGLFSSQNCRPRAATSTHRTGRPCSRKRNCSRPFQRLQRADRPARIGDSAAGDRHRRRHGERPASAHRRHSLAGVGDHLLREVKRPPARAEHRRRAAHPPRPAVGQKARQRPAIAAQDRGRDVGRGVGQQPATRSSTNQAGVSGASPCRFTTMS